jgi:spore germination protein GerM
VTRARTHLLRAVVVAVLAGGCTVPTNDEPVELSGSIVPDTTTSTSTTSPETDTRQAFAYFLETSDSGTVLRRVPRTVEAGTGVQGVLSNMFTQRPREDVPLEEGLTSAIPESATLLSATPSEEDPNVLVVDVGGLFGNEGVQGTTLRNALAQIVWTATEGDPALQVVFRQDGERRPALVDNLEGTDDPVDRDDYQRNT